jgi:hypothetical protein
VTRNCENQRFNATSHELYSDAHIDDIATACIAHDSCGSRRHIMAESHRNPNNRLSICCERTSKSYQKHFASYSSTRSSNSATPHSRWRWRALDDSIRLHT